MESCLSPKQRGLQKKKNGGSGERQNGFRKRLPEETGKDTWAVTSIISRKSLTAYASLSLSLSIRNYGKRIGSEGWVSRAGV
jgi:hypothetical protein